MIGLIIDIIEPLRWSAYKSLTKTEFAEVQFGRCSVYGTSDFIEMAKYAAGMIKELDESLWEEITKTQFYLVQESEAGSYGRTSVKKFTLFKYATDGGYEQFGCCWVSLFFMAKEIDGWSLWQRAFQRAPLKESVASSLQWIESKELEGVVSEQLRKTVELS